MGVMLVEPRVGRRMVWAASRVLFHAYAVICIASVVGGYLTAPLFTWIFYGDWRFWRHVRSASLLWAHGCQMIFLILRGQNSGFSLSVALTAPPTTAVDPLLVRLSPRWEFGLSCGPCNRCCSKHHCPILDPRTGLCRGHDSFFWRYFNCGRFPTRQSEIDYYLCPKWELYGTRDPVYAFPSTARSSRTRTPITDESPPASITDWARATVDDPGKCMERHR